MDQFGIDKESVGTILDLDVRFVAFKKTCNIHNTIKDVQIKFQTLKKVRCNM